MPEEFVLQSYKFSNIQELGSLQSKAASKSDENILKDNP